MPKHKRNKEICYKVRKIIASLCRHEEKEKEGKERHRDRCTSTTYHVEDKSRYFDGKRGIWRES